MPMNKEERAAYDKVYRENHKEMLKAKRKVYSENHKERIAAGQKAYREKNKEEKAAYDKAYRQSSEGKKSRRINNWKQRGIISDDWNSLYERYLGCKNCEECNVELTEGRYNTSTTRCLDHDHSITDRENVRNVLCNACNTKRG